MANHGPSYGLDAELKNKRDAALDPKLEGEAREWIAAVGGTPIGPDLAASLNDGVLLCNFINKLKPGTITKINTGKMPFQKMENINNYLLACKNFGVKQVDLFQTVDLYEAKNIPAVIRNFHALGRVSRNIPGFKGPYIGVKESDRHEVQFTAEQMKKGQSELGLLTKGQVEHASSGVDRSRDVYKLHEQKW